MDDFCVHNNHRVVNKTIDIDENEDIVEREIVFCYDCLKTVMLRSRKYPEEC